MRGSPILSSSYFLFPYPCWFLYVSSITLWLICADVVWGMQPFSWDSRSHQKLGSDNLKRCNRSPWWEDMDMFCSWGRFRIPDEIFGSYWSCVFHMFGYLKLINYTGPEQQKHTQNGYIVVPCSNIATQASNATVMSGDTWRFSWGLLCKILWVICDL